MYLDPSEGKAGASLDSIFGAAASGTLQVDPHTGEATLKFLNDIQELAVQLRGRVAEVNVVTPLGGGFGEEIGRFNQSLAAGGSNSAQDVLTTFIDELTRLKEAVSVSMRNYVAMDGANAQTVAAAGRTRP